MTRRTVEARRRLLILLMVPIAAALLAPRLGQPLPALAASSTSSSVGYLTDSTNGGYNLWNDAFGITAPADPGSYSTHTPAGALTVTTHNISMAALDMPSTSALTSPAIDTLVMFAVCDLGNRPNAVKAINAFVDAGGKIIILDGAQCTDGNGGVPDYTTFIKPFTSKFVDPDPQLLASTPYSFVGESGSPLTTGFPDCSPGATNGCEAGNSVADASVLSPNSTGWCAALSGTTNNGTTGTKGPVMAYTHSPSGKGLIVYEGEAFAWSVPSAQNKAHLRLAFDDMLTQTWNSDALTCGRPTKSLVLAPTSATKSVGGGDQQLTATVTSAGSGTAGVLVTFTVTSGPNVGTTPLTATTIADGTATVSYHSTKAGADTWQATFSDTDDHVSNLSTVTWNKGTQAITYTSTAPGNAVVGGPTYTVAATGGGSGNPVTFTIDAAAAAVCTISGTTVSFTGVGSCVIDANQAGNANYNAATQAQQTFSVGKGSQTISYTSTAPSSAVVGGPTYGVAATGGASGNTVTFTIDAAASSVCSISGSTVSFIGVGSCVIDANQAGNSNYNAATQTQQSFAVGKGSQNVSFTSTAPSNAVIGGPTYGVSATGGPSGNTVTFTIDGSATSVCSISGTTVSFTAAGTCVIDANQAGNANYNPAAQAQQSFPVSKVPQTIAFTSGAPSNAVVGGPSYAVSATGGASGNAVTFTIDGSASSVCSISGTTVSFAGPGTCVIDANQAGNGTYAAAPQAQQSFAVVPPTTSHPGQYRLIATDGGVFPFGGAVGAGSTGGIHLNKPIVGAAATPSQNGYWLVAADGGIFPFGDAVGYGSTGGITLNQPIVGMAATPDGGGYWLVAADGGIFPFGDAIGYGSTGGIHLNKPIVGMAATPDGHGYWLVATDGGIFPFGDAVGYGSTGGIHLNQQIQSMATTPDGGGYWLVAADGGIFPFGDAVGYGSTGGIHLNKPIVDMVTSPSGRGYLLVASDGGVFPFGDYIATGSLGGTHLNQPIITVITG